MESKRDTFDTSGSLSVGRLVDHPAILRGIIETAPDAIISIDEEHRILLFNRAAERIFGYQAEEILGRDLALLLPEPVAERHRYYVQEFIRTGHSPVLGRVMEGMARRRDGKLFPVEISRSATKIDGSWVFTAILRDMSRQREIERRLLENEKLAAVGLAVSRIVHEIKNPLVAIGGLVLSLLRKSEDPSQKKKLELILREVERLERLLSDINDFAKPLSLERKEIDIVALCKEVLEVYRSRLEEAGIRFQLKSPQEKIVAQVDEARLKEVLFNLLQNALEAMAEKGGELEIEISPREDSLRIIVRDTGPGIPEKVLKQLFTPFFTTKSKGTGLGLSISRKIIEAHGGRIFARNYERGAEFIIELPWKDKSSADR